MTSTLEFERSRGFKVGVDSLVVVGRFPQSGPGLLRELPRLRAAPADALAVGVVDVPKIIQRASLANLRQGPAVSPRRKPERPVL